MSLITSLHCNPQLCPWVLQSDQRTTLRIKVAKMSFLSVPKALKEEPLLLSTERSLLRWFKNVIKMPPGSFLLEAIYTHSTGKRPPGQIENMLQAHTKYPILLGTQVSAEGLGYTLLSFHQKLMDAKTLDWLHKPFCVSVADAEVFVFFRVCFLAEGHTCQTSFSFGN